MPLILSPTQVGFNAREDGKFNRTFPEQTTFFKNKLNMPTQHYQDVLGAAHDRSFMVAGAMKADLLTDLKKAVDKSIADGKSFDWFKKEFEGIVQKHGWEGWTGSETKAGRDWRARVIYQTNLSTSYAAGRYQQMTDPAVLEALPYWKYLHNDSVHHPRPLHVEWSGTVLPHDDPWFDVHFAPNGYGCRCRIVPTDASEYEGKRAPDNGTYTFVDKQGVSHQVPAGVDYGFGYTPGKSNSTAAIKGVIDTKLATLPARIGSDMAQALKPVLAKETAAAYGSWLKAIESEPAAKSSVAIVGAIARQDLDWLAAKNIIPITAEIAIGSSVINGPKAVRHQKAGDALSVDDWADLPERIAAPQAVFLDNASGKLLYVLPEAGVRRPQIVVEFDYQTGKTKRVTNMIVSAYRPKREDLVSRVKNGSLTLMRGKLD